MKTFKCPYCEYHAVKAWELIVFPSPFWLWRRCRVCKNKIRFDENTIKFFLVSLFGGLTIGVITYSLHPVNVVFLFLFLCLPLLFGKRLFSKHRDIAEFHEGMSEWEFIDAIQNGLLFETEDDYKHALRIGSSISDNACLMLGYRLAVGEFEGDMAFRNRLLDLIKTYRPSPVVKAAVPVIRALIDDASVDSRDIRALVETARETPGTYNALLIVSISDDSLQDECQTIAESWQSL